MYPFPSVHCLCEWHAEVNHHSCFIAGCIIIEYWNHNWVTLLSSSKSTDPLPTSNTPSPKGVRITYDELSRTAVGSNTRVVLSLSATLISGGSVTLDYSRFALSAFVVRGGLLPANIGMKYTEVNPQGTGTVTVDSNNPMSIFQLTFEFASQGKNFEDYLRPFSYYELCYSSYYDNPINVQWANQ